MKTEIVTEAVSNTPRHLRYEYATNKRTGELSRHLVNEVNRYLINKFPKAKFRVAEVSADYSAEPMVNIDNPGTPPERRQTGYQPFDLSSISSYNMKTELNFHSTREQHFLRRAMTEMVRDFFGQHHVKAGGTFESDVEATEWGAVVRVLVSANPGALEGTPELLTDDDMKQLSAEMRTAVAHAVGEHMTGILIRYGSDRGSKMTELNPSANLAHVTEYPFYWFIIGFRWKTPPVLNYEGNTEVEMANKFAKMQQKHVTNDASKKLEAGYAKIVSEILKDAATHDMSITDFLDQVKQKIEY